MNRLVAFCTLLLVSLLATLGCSKETLYSIKFSGTPLSRKASWRSPVPPFLVVSDTQYAVPFTDYDLVYQLGDQRIDLPPVLSTMASKSFYRNAEAHFGVPLALDSLLTRSETDYRFGLFGGDMAEFSCKRETERMFEVLKAHPKLPFIITIGNHDVAFHGSFDTAASAANPTDWDLYSFDLWRSVCEHEGGPLTKPGFILQTLDYYAEVWKFDFEPILGGKVPKLGKRAQGVVTNRDGWQLELDVELAFEEGREAHRQSHLYQRFTHVDPAGDQQPIAFTSLDTTDFGGRPVLCSTSKLAESIASRLVQIGLGGAVSDPQVSWLEERPLGPDVPHFVLSHYLPFQDVAGLDSCDSTFGTHCLGARLMTALRGATYIYGHVHQSFKEGNIDRPACWSMNCGRGPCTPELRDDPTCTALGRNPIVRVPSLIDNKAYVVFDGDKFSSRDLLKAGELIGRPPFQTLTTTCDQRVYEYVELKAMIDCLKPTVGQSVAPGCFDEKSIAREVQQLSPQLCRGSAQAWKASHANDMARYAASPDPAAKPGVEVSSLGVCSGWQPASHWRCILRGLSYDALAQTRLAKAEQARLGEALLSAARPKRIDDDQKLR